jgi:hypothetical protein
MPDRRWFAALLQPLSVVVFVLGFLLMSSVAVVRWRLLDAEFYADALVRSEAYERTYTEVLADPELADVVERLLGGLGTERIDPVQARAFATSSLRLAVPPSTLRQGSEAFIFALVAYLRGDVDRLDADVDVAEVLDHVADAGVARARAALASADDRTVGSVEEYRAAVGTFVDRLAAGEVPAEIPVLADVGVDAAVVADVLVERFGAVDPAVREQIEAAARAGDERDALIDATSGLVRARAAEAVTTLQTELEGGRDFDVVAEVAERAGRSRATVIHRLDTVRDAAGWFGPGTAALGGVLMAGAGAGLVWSERRRPARAALLVAVAAAVAGLALLGSWLLVSRLVAAPLAPAVAAGEGSWGLPAGVRALVADVQAELGDDLASTVRRLALIPLVGGVALGVGIVAATRLRMPTSRAVTVAGALGAGAALLVWALPTRSADAKVRACNGASELCDRAYDEVVYAATHNSMSSPDVVWLWPEHDADIGAQLDAGVRALLIDTHHWTPLVSPEQLTTAYDGLPPELANRVFASLGSRREARPGAYLCHNQCALGAIPLVDALVTVRRFLADNPDEVVTLIIQDAIPADETADAFTAAGLDRYLHTHKPGTAWATLGDLIERDERLVVFAEDDGPPPAWYLAAFENMQDTPFRFESPAELSCALNRGDPDAPLFLMNHWITRLTPDRATAARVNRHDVLVDRARECADERGLLPNFVAVDFFGIGDLVPAVATLNGVD